MKATGKLLAASLAAASLAVAFDAEARRGHGFRHGHGHGHHGHHGHWRGHWGWSIGVPLALGAAWGWPYWNDYYYPRETVIYRERIVEPEFREGRIAPAPGDAIPRGEGTPAQGPLYMNYCASAQAYFPKVTKCPEGWKFITPTN